jgi:hypothetical protein
MKILVLQRLATETEPIFAVIADCAKAAFATAHEKAVVYRTDQFAGEVPPQDVVLKAITEADLVICNLAQADQGVHYEIGMVQANKTPMVMLSNGPENLPYSLKYYPALFEEQSSLHFSQALLVWLKAIAANMSKVFAQYERAANSRTHVFVSYSHVDRPVLDRLLVHLRPLVKKQLIDLWVDTSLKSGDRWKRKVEDALGRAQVAVLLVSADFLASDFIVDNELPPLLSAAEKKGTRIIPVIVKPCRFLRDPHLNVFQAANDPRTPLISMTEGDRESVLNGISEQIESALKDRMREDGSNKPSEATP